MDYTITAARVRDVQEAEVDCWQRQIISNADLEVNVVGLALKQYN